jgi:hypothetical protein
VHLQRIMMLPPRAPRGPRVRITATEMISATSASTTSAAATIAATAAIWGTPLSDVLGAATIAFGLPDDGAGFLSVCCVVLVGCFFLCVVCAWCLA